MKLSGFVFLLLKPLIIAAIIGILFVLLVNPVNSEFSTATTAVQAYSSTIFIGWIFFSAFLLLRADEEWKKTEEAVRKKDFAEFKIQAPKMMAKSVVVTYVVIALLSITSFFLFHFDSNLLGFIIVAGASFMIFLTMFVLFDLDNPLDGLIVVENIPKDWIEKVK